MTNLFRNILDDLKKGIDDNVDMYENPVRPVGTIVDEYGQVVAEQSLVWNPTSESLSKVYGLKVLDQVDPLMRMIRRDTEDGNRGYRFADRQIKGRLESLSRFFKERGYRELTRKEWEFYGQELKKLKRCTDAFYRFCTV